MLIAYRRRKGLSIADVYFNDGEDIQFDKHVDLVFFLQKSQQETRSISFCTLHINLLKDEETLFSEMNRTTKYHINRAMKRDPIECSIGVPARQDIEEFNIFYNAFSELKGLSRCNKKKLYALSISDGLILSKAVSKENNILCYHAYIADKNRARLLYSASHFRITNDNHERALIGRANKYLHWYDIKWLKEQGYRIYDFGGFAINKQDKELVNIANFKKGFGGDAVEEYNLIKANSILGRIALLLIRRKIEG